MGRGGRREGSGRKRKLGPAGATSETVSQVIENGKALEKAAAIHAANRETIEFLKKRGSIPKEVVFPRHPPAPAPPRMARSPAGPPSIPAPPYQELTVRFLLIGPQGCACVSSVPRAARGELRSFTKDLRAVGSAWASHSPYLRDEAQRLGVRPIWSRREFFAERVARIYHV